MKTKFYLPALCALGLAASGAASQAQTITVLNPSFEANAIGGVGYGHITDWASTIANQGVNTQLQGTSSSVAPGGGGAFANNGVIPDGQQVAFLQDNGTSVMNVYINQNLSGFTPNTPYLLTFYDNARANNTSQTLSVYYGGTVSVDTVGGDIVTVTGGQDIYDSPSITGVEGINSFTKPYYEIQQTFTPATASGLLTFVATSGNGAVLLDNISIAPAPAPEPSQNAALAVGILGLAGLGLAARRRRRIAL